MFTLFLKEQGSLGSQKAKLSEYQKTEVFKMKSKRGFHLILKTTINEVHEVFLK